MFSGSLNAISSTHPSNGSQSTSINAKKVIIECFVGNGNTFHQRTIPETPSSNTSSEGGVTIDEREERCSKQVFPIESNFSERKWIDFNDPEEADFLSMSWNLQRK